MGINILLAIFNAILNWQMSYTSKKDKKFVYVVVLENCDKNMHFRFNFDACPMHSPFGFVHLTQQNF